MSNKIFEKERKQESLKDQMDRCTRLRQAYINEVEQSPEPIPPVNESQSLTKQHRG
jgi:hypothetical protein